MDAQALRTRPEAGAHAPYAELVATLIHTRQQLSPKRLDAPGPTPEQATAYFSAAAAAPDHGQITPWRFVVVPDAARDRLGEAFVEALLQREPDALPGQILDARERAHRAPFLALAIARTGDDDRDDIPAAERLVSLGAALQNMLLSAHADGFGCGLASGQSIHSDVMRRLFGVAANEVPVCFVAIGTASRRKPIRQRPLPADFVRVLNDRD